MIPHRMVAWNGYDTAVCWDLRAEDRSPIFTPLSRRRTLRLLVPIFTIGGGQSDPRSETGDSEELRPRRRRGAAQRILDFFRSFVGVARDGS